MKKIHHLLLALLLVATACEDFTEPTAFAPTFQLNDATDITRLTATLSGSITNNGGEITEYGFTYGLYENLGNATDVPFSGTPSGRIEATLENLDPNTTYYYRLYAGSGASTVTSEVRSFKTNASDAPSLGYTEELDKNEQSLTVSCQVEDDGGYDIIMMGVAYRRSDSQKYSLALLDEPTYESYTLTVEGLEAGTTYMVCGFAISRGGIGYGNETEITTEDSEAPVVNTGEASNIGGSWFVATGQQLSEGFSAVVERGFCYSATSKSPTLSDGYVVAEGKANETFSATISGLEGNTTYYVRAFARNGTKTGYGKTVEVTTRQITVPTMTTLATDNISSDQVDVQSSVTGFGNGIVSTIGFCYSATETTPTIDNAEVVYVNDAIGAEGFEFATTLTGLAPGTTYYITAFAVNEAGVAYSEAVSITTINTYVPVLTIVTVTDITARTATLAATITDGGNREVTQYGFCWTNDGSEPTPDNCIGKYVVDSSAGEFSCSITDLLPSTTYKVRAFAVNAVGTGYGESVEFTTAVDPVPGEDDNVSPDEM